MTDQELLKEICRIKIIYLKDHYYENWGKNLFKLFTQHGLPPDIGLEELEKLGGKKFSKDEKLAIIVAFLDEMTEHKIKSGIGEKRLQQLKEHNKKILKGFLEKEEIGIY